MLFTFIIVCLGCWLIFVRTAFEPARFVDTSKDSSAKGSHNHETKYDIFKHTKTSIIEKVHMHFGTQKRRFCAFPK